MTFKTHGVSVRALSVTLESHRRFREGSDLFIDYL